MDVLEAKGPPCAMLVDISSLYILQQKWFTSKIHKSPINAEKRECNGIDDNLHTNYIRSSYNNEASKHSEKKKSNKEGNYDYPYL